MRLPTEAEWEKAATWDQEQHRARRSPVGRRGAVAGVHANLEQLARGTVPSAALTAGASPCGCLAMVGDVWEWTSTIFDGYPGFSPFPYPEYSEVFFADGYRVLRGGSWATRPGWPPRPPQLGPAPAPSDLRRSARRPKPLREG